MFLVCYKSKSKCLETREKDVIENEKENSVVINDILDLHFKCQSTYSACIC